MSFFDTCSIKKRHPERDGSQVGFSLFFCGFLEGPTLDPLAPAQSKHSLPFSAWPLKGSRFYCSRWGIFCTFGVGISLKGTSKLNLKKQTAKMFHFCILALLGTLLDTLWEVFSCLWGVGALKKARFSRAWGPGTSKGGVSPCLGPLALQRYCVFLSRAPRVTQKTTI